MEDARIQYNALIEEVKNFDLAYRHGNSSVSDEVYDGKYAKLKEFERDYPSLTRKDSPTISMDHYKASIQKLIFHAKHMKSIENAYNDSDIVDFIERIKKGSQETSITLEYKLDGVALALKYKGGKLSTVATRGDGVSGEDLTFMSSSIQGIPKKIKYKAAIEIYGEALIKKSVFITLNYDRKAHGLSEWANSRNLVAGSLHMKFASEVAKRSICFIAYGVNFDHFAKNQKALIEKLNSLGFEANKILCAAHSLSRMKKIIDLVVFERESIDFDIDGIVLKVSDLKKRILFGESSKFYKWQIAYKLPASASETVIKDIFYQIGSSGRITPIANLYPVHLCGVTISKATLYNFAEIRRLDVRLGDVVTLERRGDVIPKIVAVRVDLRSIASVPVVFPDKCPGCQSILISENDLKVVKCSQQDSCPHVFNKAIKRFVSRGFMDIKSLGPKIIDRLIASGFISSYISIYKLREQDIGKLPGLGNVIAKVIVNSIDASKKQPEYKLLAAFGVEGVGTVVARSILMHFKSIDRMFLSTSVDDFLHIDGVGKEIANSIFRFLISDHGIHLKEITEFGVGVPLSLEKKQSIVYSITGSFDELSRQELIDIIHRQGNVFSKTISKKCNFLICGKNPGSKLHQAKEVEVKVITLTDFISAREHL